MHKITYFMHEDEGHEVNGAGAFTWTKSEEY
jgi:hypothetical protein